MFSIEQSFGSLICPFLRKNEACGRSHCVFSHKSDATSNVKSAVSLQNNPFVADWNEKVNELEYDPVSNFSVDGLTPQTESSESNNVCKEPNISQAATLIEGVEHESKPVEIRENKLNFKDPRQKDSTGKKASASSKSNSELDRTKVKAKRKILTDLDFLSIKNGGSDIDELDDTQPEKKKVKKTKLKESNSAKDTPSKTVKTKSKDFDVPKEVDTESLKVDLSPSKSADMMKKRLELLSQLKATLGTPNKRLPVLINPAETNKVNKIPCPTQSVVSEPPKEETVLGMSAARVRVAHQSKESIASDRRPSLVIPAAAPQEEVKKPMIQPVPNGHLAKIPTVMRQLYLDKFFEQYRKITTTADAFKKSAESERAIYDKVNSKTVYMSSCVNALKRLATQSVQQTQASQTLPEEKGPEALKLISPTEIQNVSGESFYKLCERYCLSEAELELHGYPGYGASNKTVSPLNRDELTEDDTEDRVCHRCGASFTVYALSGLPVTGRLEIGELNWHLHNEYFQCLLFTKTYFLENEI